MISDSSSPLNLICPKSGTLPLTQAPGTSISMDTFFVRLFLFNSITKSGVMNHE